MPFRSRAGRALFVSVCLLLAVTYLSALFAPSAATYHDDGIYLVTARALAEGKGYRIISIPGEPFQTKYPILFPWMVSLLWRVYPAFPENLPWLRLLVIASGAAWLALSWRLLRRLGIGRDGAWVIVLLLAASPSVLFFSTTLQSEMPFAALVAAGLLVLTRVHDGEGRRYDGLLIGLLMGASLLTRSVGVACVLGAVIALAIERRWRLVAQCAVGSLVLALPWVWWITQHNAGAAAIDTYNAASVYGSWNIVTNYSWAEKMRVVWLNTLYFGLAPALFWDFKTVPWLALIAAAMFFTIAGRGLWIVGRHPAAIVTIAYVGTVMCWVWPPFRFLAPMAPGIAWLVITGLPANALSALRALTLVIAIALASRWWGENLERVEKGATWPAAGFADNWRMTAPLLEWIKRATPADAIVTGNLDPAYFLFTDRQAVRAFNPDAYALYYAPQDGTKQPLGTVEQFRRRLLSSGATYLVMTPGAGFGETPYLRRLVAELATGHPGSLSIAFGDVDAGYVIYQIHRERLTDPIIRSD